MKQLDKYRALVDRIRKCHQMETDEVMKESGWRPY